MQIVYLKLARDDLVWMRTYYTRIFPNGAKRARQHFLTAETLLLNYPEIGRPTDFDNVRELNISKTPFSIIYRSTQQQIEVLRVWDGRADPAGFNID